MAGMDPTFVECLALLTVKSGFKRGDNLIIVVSLAILDRQEREFGDLVVALQRADGQFSIEMSKGALKIDRALEPKRLALAKAREALRAVITAAETPRQKKLAERALGYEKNWSRNEESLNRVEAMRHGIFLPIR